MRKLPIPGRGRAVHTGTALDDSKAAEVDLAVAVKVHHPAGILVKVYVVLVTLVEAKSTAFALFAVKTVLLPATP